MFYGGESMEEIKFRVWDKTRKVMYKDVKLDHAYFYIHKVSKSDTDYNSFEFYLNGERNFEWEDLEVIGNIYEILRGGESNDFERNF